MKVEQLNEIIKDVYSQITGSTELEAIDVKNIVTVGDKILDSTDVENYVKVLTDRIGKTVFNMRKYSGNGTNILMDSWEYGSVLQKINVSIDDDKSVTTNETWNLTHGKQYTQDTFFAPVVETKLFNKKVTFEIDISFTERQVKSSFSSESEFNTFISTIYNAVENSFTVKLDGLIMATINNMIAGTYHTDIVTPTANTSAKCVNLLHLYNEKFTPATPLTVETALTNADFLKFSTMLLNTYTDRMAKINSIYNCNNKQRFTPKTDLKCMMLSDFKTACNSYLKADTFHKDLIDLPEAETVAYWQGSGGDYEFDNVSKIHINAKLPNNTDSEVTVNGVLAIMFDKNAVAVCNEDRRVTTHYNAKGEFFTNFYKFDCSYLNDFDENFVVFFIA